MHKHLTHVILEMYTTTADTLIEQSDYTVVRDTPCSVTGRFSCSVSVCITQNKKWWDYSDIHGGGLRKAHIPTHKTSAKFEIVCNKLVRNSFKKISNKIVVIFLVPHMLNNADGKTNNLLVGYPGVMWIKSSITIILLSVLYYQLNVIKDVHKKSSHPSNTLYILVLF